MRNNINVAALCSELEQKLIARFQERGGYVSTDEHSQKEETYFRCIRMLTEY